MRNLRQIITQISENKFQTQFGYIEFIIYRKIQNNEKPMVTTVFFFQKEK
jgi:hypothetical protein